MMVYDKSLSDIRFSLLVLLYVITSIHALYSVPFYKLLREVLIVLFTYFFLGN